MAAGGVCSQLVPGPAVARRQLHDARQTRARRLQRPYGMSCAPPGATMWAGSLPGPFCNPVLAERVSMQYVWFWGTWGCVSVGASATAPCSSCCTTQLQQRGFTLGEAVASGDKHSSLSCAHQACFVSIQPGSALLDRRVPPVVPHTTHLFIALSGRQQQLSSTVSGVHHTCSMLPRLCLQ